MGLHLIIDGYNLIRQSLELSELDARDLALGREALLARLAAYRRARPAHLVTVIFDGREAGDVKESHGNSERRARKQRSRKEGTLSGSAFPG